MNKAPSELLLNHFCARCGCMVNRWHKHWTNDAKDGDAATAKSEWIK